MALSKAIARSWQERFIISLSKNPNVTQACKTAKVGRALAYNERGRNAEFARRWDEALDEGVETLEAEAHRRAMRQSDTLMIFLLKAHRPEKYRDRWDGDLRLRGSVGIHPMDLSQLSDEDLELLEEIVGKIGITGSGLHADEIAAHAGGDPDGESQALALPAGMDTAEGAAE